MAGVPHHSAHTPSRLLAAGARSICERIGDVQDQGHRPAPSVLTQASGALSSGSREPLPRRGRERQWRRGPARSLDGRAAAGPLDDAALSSPSSSRRASRDPARASRSRPRRPSSFACRQCKKPCSERCGRGARPAFAAACTPVDLCRSSAGLPTRSTRCASTRPRKRTEVCARTRQEVAHRRRRRTVTPPGASLRRLLAPLCDARGRAPHQIRSSHPRRRATSEPRSGGRRPRRLAVRSRSEMPPCTSAGPRRFAPRPRRPSTSSSRLAEAETSSELADLLARASDDPRRPTGRRLVQTGTTPSSTGEARNGEHRARRRLEPSPQTGAASLRVRYAFGGTSVTKTHLAKVPDVEAADDRGRERF
jgi:hypothetical protein